ncbi:exodeoxyribonuclease VII large subunit [Amphibacillus cookii]|uniref:exodeoxyribonuclease VII large subunit n=1 Tax=Amphibacillus cookii TaxID=767787 RepID=UPI00195CD956|nr:exodeoxyribonuclease VII large subunit [Amphibacillus cookii]MBM7542440.1 exodeoxyribonuclease VII large subunit [Amphibacillus cookii]
MNPKYLTVTALTRYIKRKFELDDHLSTVWLKAEISNFKHHSRGHMYFTLKDDNARILAVMFAGYNRFLKFKPEDGMDVIVKGQVNVYEPQGQYQLYVHEMIPDGVGALHLAFEQLKNKLEKEGLFDQQNKKNIPTIPRHLGIITSETGAAIRDILTTIRRRFPLVKVTLFPALVQGDGAKYDLVKKLEQANDDQTIDTLILARGGGSIEELWPFNEEMVARAVAASHIPIISGIGHETDFTIVDFIADLRAATPTGAAELAVPSKKDIANQIESNRRTLHRGIKAVINRNEAKLNKIQSSYAFKYPKQLLSQKEQELDRLIESIHRNMKSNLTKQQFHYHQLMSRLHSKHPTQQIKLNQQKAGYLTNALENNFKSHFRNKVVQFEKQLDKLKVLSPLETMKRGYGIGYSSSGSLIKSVKQVAPGEQVTFKLQDGYLDCQIWGIEEDQNE